MSASRGAGSEPAGAAHRAAAVAALLLVALSAAHTFSRSSGPAAFGRPAWLAAPLLLAGAAAAWAAWRAPQRLDLARLLTLALVACALFAGAAVPALPGLVLALAGVALWTAAPWLRPGAMALAALVVLLAGVPAALTTRFPGGMATWLVALLPLLALTVLLPSLLPGRRLTPALWVLAFGSALVALAGLGGYLDLAARLPFDLGPLLRTRLRVLGAHPNLGVPALVTSALVALSLMLGRGRRAAADDASSDDGQPLHAGMTPDDLASAAPHAPHARQASAGAPRWQRPAAALSVALLLAALAAVGSRTGALLAAGSLAGCLVAGHLRLPWRRLLPALVIVALLLPATGLADGTITRSSSSTVSKAVSFRSHMWLLGRSHLADAPWTGHGAHTQYLQGLQATRGRYDVLPASDHPHNLLLWVGAAFGWTGLAALAWLLFASFASAELRDLRGRALTFALLAAWLATAIDLGGATSTFLPALALLFGSLLEAHGRASGNDSAGASEPDTAGGASSVAAGAAGGTTGAGRDAGVTASGARRAWALAGLLLVAVGLPRAWGLHLLRAADASLTDAELPDASAARGSAERLQRWAWTLPFDHRPALLRSRLLALDPTRAPGAPPRPGVETSLDALEQAVALAPDLSGPLHALALLRSQRDLDDPSVVTLLDRARALGGPAPQAAQLQLDRAQMAGHHGDAEGAFAALLEAVLLSPGVVARCRTAPGSGDLLLGVDGQHVVAVPPRRLLQTLTELAAEHEDDDPNYAQRLLISLPQVAAAVGDATLLQESLATLAKARQDLALRQRIDSARAAGDHGTALALLLELDDRTSFKPLAQLVEAAAHAEPFDEALCQRVWQRVPAMLPDLLFELGNLETLLRGRLEWARRSDDVEAVRQLEAGLEWLDS